MDRLVLAKYNLAEFRRFFFVREWGRMGHQGPRGDSVTGKKLFQKGFRRLSHILDRIGENENRY